MKKSSFAFVSITVAFVLAMACVMLSRTVSFGSASINSEASRGRIDLNTATVEQLSMLPGIGPVLAERIIEYRQTHGPFTAPKDLLNVQGIGKKNYEKIRMYIKVGG